MPTANMELQHRWVRTVEKNRNCLTKMRSLKGYECTKWRFNAMMLLNCAKEKMQMLASAARARSLGRIQTIGRSRHPRPWFETRIPVQRWADLLKDKVSCTSLPPRLVVFPIRTATWAAATALEIGGVHQGKLLVSRSIHTIPNCAKRHIR